MKISKKIEQTKEASEEAHARAASLEDELQRCRLNERALMDENACLKHEKEILEKSLQNEQNAQHASDDSAAPASSKLPSAKPRPHPAPPARDAFEEAEQRWQLEEQADPCRGFAPPKRQPLRPDE